MELKEGMFVRFKDKRGVTYIRKITKLANEYPQKLYGMEIDKEANYSNYLSSKNIINADFDITKLIEVGDYVNGLQVDFIKDGYIVGNYDFDCWNSAIQIKIEDIKTIVTREQFNSWKYEVNS